MPRSCVYTLRSGKPCGRPGSGNPCLCQAHLADLAEAEDLDELDDYDTGNEILDQVLAHPATRDVLGRLTSLIDKAGVALERGINTMGSHGPTSSPPRRPPPKPGMSEREARVVLGFAPDAKLTPQLVKDRKRQLAKIFHSDHAGNTEAMTRVNVAADLLLKKPTA